MLEQTEMQWLVAERPAPLRLDQATTDRVRGELLAHATEGRSGARAGGSRRPLALRLLARRPARIAAFGAVLAAACGALLTSGGGGTARHPGTGLGALVSVPPAAAAPLAHLTAKLAAAPPPPVGDATLVIRRQVYPSSPEIDGADLYADDGDYYYATSLAGLPAVIKQGDTVNTGGPGVQTREVAAARAALTEPIDQARQQMSIANLDLGGKAKWVTPWGATGQLSGAVRQKLEQAQKTAAADDIRSEMSHEDGMIWDNSIDALLAGAGDPQVRAGVLKLLGTVPQIAIAQGTLNGTPTLSLTASVLSSKQGIYEEQLILNAGTGIPMEMIGGNVGQTPTVTTYYTISRVTVAAIEDGSQPG